MRVTAGQSDEKLIDPLGTPTEGLEAGRRVTQKSRRKGSMMDGMRGGAK